MFKTDKTQSGKYSKYLINLFLIVILFSSCATTLNNSGKHDIKSGKSFKIEFEYYPSVGWDASYEISNSLVIKMDKRTISQKRPIKLFTRMTGADEAKGCFKFKTLKPGNSTVTIHRIFRGDIESTDTFDIKVY